MAFFLVLYFIKNQHIISSLQEFFCTTDFFIFWEMRLNLQQLTIAPFFGIQNEKANNFITFIICDIFCVLKDSFC
jgi:hypothetical protein